MKKNIITALCLFTPLICSAQSIESFISSNELLNNNIEARHLIKEDAALLAMQDAINEGDGNLARRDKLLREDGDKYAALSIKRYKKSCNGDKRTVLLSQPDDEMCAFFLGLNNK